MHAEGERLLVFGVDEEGDAVAALRGGFDCGNGTDGAGEKDKANSKSLRGLFKGRTFSLGRD